MNNAYTAMHAHPRHTSHKCLLVPCRQVTTNHTDHRELAAAIHNRTGKAWCGADVTSACGIQDVLYSGISLAESAVAGS